MLDFQRVNFNPQVGVFLFFSLVMMDERNGHLRNRTDCPLQPECCYINSLCGCTGGGMFTFYIWYINTCFKELGRQGLAILKIHDRLYISLFSSISSVTDVDLSVSVVDVGRGGSETC